MILAIETATPVCSVALAAANGTIDEKRSAEQGSHSENLFTFIKELLEKLQSTMDDVSEVIVSAGPGSYTGLRIAASGVKGLLFGQKASLRTVPTLLSYAMATLPATGAASTRVHAVIDARRQHLYHQSVQLSADRLQIEQQTAIRKLSEVQTALQPGDWIIGTGLERLELSNLEPSHIVDQEHITARSLLACRNHAHAKKYMQKISPADFNPIYGSSAQINNS